MTSGREDPRDSGEAQLLPCPFCGSPAKLCTYGKDTQIVCSGVDHMGQCAMMPCTPCEPRTKAITRWNTRSKPLSEGRVSDSARDTARLDWLEGEMKREDDAWRDDKPMPKSLFRSNNPITREAIDNALSSQQKEQSK